MHAQGFQRHDATEVNVAKLERQAIANASLAPCRMTHPQTEIGAERPRAAVHEHVALA